MDAWMLDDVFVYKHMVLALKDCLRSLKLKFNASRSFWTAPFNQQ